MGIATLGDLKDEIVVALGNRPIKDSARLAKAITLAEMRIARLHRWEELQRVYKSNFTITADPEDDKYVSFQDNLRDVYSFRVITSDGRSKKLIKKTFREWDKCIPEPEFYTRALPSIYTVYNNTAEVYRVPDIAYEIIIRATIWPAQLSDNSQTSDLDNKDDMIIALATSWYFQTLGRSDDASKWWRIYSNAANSALGEEIENPDQLIAAPAEIARASGGPGGEYYKDPFVKSMP